jgi:hypothetical protein
MTVRLPDDFQPRLVALAEASGVRPAEFARLKLIEVIEQEERAKHAEAMEEMVRQAVAFGEVRDPALEEASLEAISRQEG